MISLTHAELTTIDESLARRMLLEVSHDFGGNVSRIARQLRCSRNTAWPSLHIPCAVSSAVTAYPRPRRRGASYTPARTHDWQDLCPSKNSKSISSMPWTSRASLSRSTTTSGVTKCLPASGPPHRPAAPA